MGLYDEYAARDRVRVGIAIKKHQAKRIFEIGMQASRAPTTSILEIGPGDGYIAELSRASRQQYAAVEGNGRIAEQLTNAGFEVYQSYVPPLPVALGTDYKCCYMLHVLEHMKTAADAAEVLTSIRDRLAPGGALVVACPDYARWGSHFYDCDYTHSFPMTKRRLAQLCAIKASTWFARLSISVRCLVIGAYQFHGLPNSSIPKFLMTSSVDTRQKTC